MARWAWVVTLSALLFTPLLPPAVATEAEGTFTTHGPIFFPPDSITQAAPLAVFVPDTTRIGAIHGTIPRLTVLSFEADYYGPAGGLLPTVQLGATRRASWNLTDVTVALAPGADREEGGFLGVYPEPGAVLTVIGQVQSEARPPGGLGNKTTGGENPDSIAYYHPVLAPHLLLSGLSTVEMTGLGSVKIRGPDVVLRAAENVSTLRTGTTRTSPTMETLSWIYLRLDAPATFTMEDTSFEAATLDEEVRMDGTLRFTPTGGTLRTSDGLYSATGKSAEMKGSFIGHLAPLTGDRTSLALSGHLRSTSLAYAPVAGLPEKSAAPWIGLLVFGSVVVGVGGGAVLTWGLLRRRQAQAPPPPPPPPPPEPAVFTVEDCREVAAIACAEENWPRGAEWFERALRFAPTSALLHADLAHCLSEMGEYERALAHYGRSHELSSETDGEAAFNAAVLALKHGDLDGTERWLLAALTRTPALVTTLGTDPEWQPLRERASVQQLEAAAWRRMRRDSEP